MNTKFRIYPDGEVIHQDDFVEKDSDGQIFDDFKVIEVPDEIIQYIEDSILGK